MANVVTTQAPPMFPQGQQAFAQWLFGNVGQGMPAYAADLFPNLATTLLPSVWGAYNPQMGNDPGSAGLMQLLAQNSQAPGMPPEMRQLFDNIKQYGGNGYPGQQMSLQQQFGGSGAPATMMSNVAQFGMPSAVGRPVQQMAQTGGAGSWGQMLQNMALGATPPAGLQYLMPFMGASPWKSPGPQGGK